MKFGISIYSFGPSCPMRGSLDGQCIFYNKTFLCNKFWCIRFLRPIFSIGKRTQTNIHVLHANNQTGSDLITSLTSFKVRPEAQGHEKHESWTLLKHWENGLSYTKLPWNRNIRHTHTSYANMAWQTQALTGFIISQLATGCHFFSA